MLNKSAGIDLTHVPYRGLPLVVQDLIGNQVQFGVIDVAVDGTGNAGRRNAQAQPRLANV